MKHKVPALILKPLGHLLDLKAVEMCLVVQEKIRTETAGEAGGESQGETRPTYFLEKSVLTLVPLSGTNPLVQGPRSHSPSVAAAPQR